MKHRARVAFLVLASTTALLSCGDEPSPPGGPPSGGPVDGIPVRGTERIAWLQTAPTLALLRDSRFFIYVDGARSPLANASCSEQNGPNGYECSAPLPSLTPGRHVLELVASQQSTGAESERSQQLIVFRQMSSTTSTVPSSPSAVPNLACTTQDSPAVCYSVATVAEMSETPRKVVALPGERLLVVSTKRVEILDDGVLQPAFEMSPGSGPTVLVDAAIDTAFDTTHLVFLAFVSSDADARVLSIVRAREVANRLGEFATIVPELPLPRRGDPVIAVGLDRHVYLAMPAASDARGDIYDGTLLRFAGDGAAAGITTTGSPIAATGLETTGAITATPGGNLWIGATRTVAETPLALFARRAASEAPEIVAVETSGTMGLDGARSLTFGEALTDNPGHHIVFVVARQPAAIYSGVASSDGRAARALGVVPLAGLEPVSVAAAPGGAFVAARRAAPDARSESLLLRLSRLP